MTAGPSSAPVADDLSQVGRALALEMLGISAQPTSAPGTLTTAATSEAIAPPDAAEYAPEVQAPVESPEPPTPRAVGPTWSIGSLPAATSPTTAPDPQVPPPATEPPTAAVPTVARPSRRHLHNSIEWLGVVLIAIAVALVVKLFVIQAFSIPSESMVDTLEVGDRVLVNKLSYDAHDIHRGDVVVFERPPAMASMPGDPEDLIKRVIGLPGETVEAHGGTVFINGRQLIEPYLEKGTRTDNLEQPVVVPKGKIFVMGDNRTRSRDSRFIGAIDEDLVVGRAFARIWPLSRIGFL